MTRTTALVAGAAVTGAAAVGIPTLAVAAVEDEPDRSDAPSAFCHEGDGAHVHGFRGGPRGHGPGDGPGRGPGRGGFGERLADREPAGELDAAQTDQLADFAQDAKLARDLYTAYADATGDFRFARLAWAEAHQLRALQAMLEVYDATDPTRGTGPGEFEDDAVAAEYDALLAEGSGSVENAVAVAVELETQQADGLDAAAEDVEEAASDVHRLYERLAHMSERQAERLEE